MIRKTYKLLKKIKATALSSYLAGRFEQNRALILTSSPRSGSTLLGQVLGAIPDSCTLFEPLHLKNVPEAEAAGFSWKTYVAPEDQWPEGELFLKQVFEGKRINDWSMREMSFLDAYKSKRLIIKFIRATRLLPWICNRFEVPPPVLLLRHPCAVIASQLNYGWKNSKRPEEPRYLNEYPMFRTALSETRGDEEYLAAKWALDQLPALCQRTPHPWTIVTYEELLLRPEATLLRIVDKWKLTINMDDALSRIKMPSSVVSSSGISGINGWKNKLTSKQISKVLNVVNSFGLSFYSDNDEADYSNLYNKELPHHIRQAGIG